MQLLLDPVSDKDETGFRVLYLVSDIRNTNKNSANVFNEEQNALSNMFIQFIQRFITSRTCLILFFHHQTVNQGNSFHGYLIRQCRCQKCLHCAYAFEALRAGNVLLFQGSQYKAKENFDTFLFINHRYTNGISMLSINTCWARVMTSSNFMMPNIYFFMSVKLCLRNGKIGKLVFIAKQSSRG